MVNFRFHIVSLVAVFLALGLGVLMGSAVVNGPIVDRLDQEVEDVRAESRSLRAANDALQDDISRASAFIAESATFAVDGRLTAVPVAFVAERGVNGDLVNQAAALVRTAGAESPVVVWLEGRWALTDEEDVQALRDATGFFGSAESVRARALEELAARLTDPQPSPAEGEEVPPDLLVALADAGFVAVEGDGVELAAFPSRGARALLVTGTDSELVGTDVTVAMTRAFGDAGAPTTVGEVFVASDDENAPARGALLAPIRGDEALAPAVSTVDDLELVQGQVASVLALQDLGAGIVGHYGYGDGASAPMPPAQPEA